MHDENRSNNSNDNFKAGNTHPTCRKPVTVALSSLFAVSMMGVAPMRAFAQQIQAPTPASVASAIAELPNPDSILTWADACHVFDIEAVFENLSLGDQGLIEPVLMDKLAACLDVAGAISDPTTLLEELQPAEEPIVAELVADGQAQEPQQPQQPQELQEPQQPEKPESPSGQATPSKENSKLADTSSSNGNAKSATDTSQSGNSSSEKEDPQPPNAVSSSISDEPGEDTPSNENENEDTANENENTTNENDNTTNEGENENAENPPSEKPGEQDPEAPSDEDGEKDTPPNGDETAGADDEGKADDKTSDEDAPADEDAGNLPESKNADGDDGESNAAEDSEKLAENEKQPEQTADEKPAESEADSSGHADGNSYVSEYPGQQYHQIHYTRNLTTEMFISSIGESARIISQEHNLYASVMIAQAIIESASGNSGLAQPPNNNLFGIKGAYNGQSVNMPTAEDDGSGNYYNINSDFRRYGSMMESMSDYANLLRSQPAWYAGVWKENAKDYKEAAWALQGTYATSTSYAESIIAVIDAYDLTRFDEGYSWRVDGRIHDEGSELADAEGNRTLTMMDYANLQGMATSFIGTPYVWGGSSPDGFDCSGLVQYVYHNALGIDLPRTTYVQQHCGVEVKFEDLRMGDLLFFNNSAEGTYHVAMYLGDGYYIHAPHTGDVVRIGSFDTFAPSFAKRVLNMVELDANGYPASTTQRYKASLQASMSWNNLFVARREEISPAFLDTQTPDGSVAGTSHKVVSVLIDRDGAFHVQVLDEEPVSDELECEAEPYMTVGQALAAIEEPDADTVSSLTVAQVLELSGEELLPESSPLTVGQALVMADEDLPAPGISIA